MSDARNDGGPAFPLGAKEAEAFAQAAEDLDNETLDNAELTYYRAKRMALGGMTLRDYFAAKAMAGLCANPGGPYQASAMRGWDIVNCKPEDIAGCAYGLADAMLAAREAA